MNKTFQEFSRLFHCSVIKVLKLFLCCLSTGATLISYHSFFSLSTTFFNFFYFYLSVLFSFLRFASGFFCVSVVSSAATCYIIPLEFPFVNNFFNFFKQQKCCILHFCWKCCKTIKHAFVFCFYRFPLNIKKRISDIADIRFTLFFNTPECRFPIFDS